MGAQLKTILGKHKVLIPAIAIATALVLAFLIVVSRSNKPAEAAPRPIDVQVVKVEQKDVPVYNEWIGTTEGITNADIKPQVSGYLLRQDYKEGSFVKKSQLLFEIDPRPFQAALDQAQGQLAQFLGQLEQVSSQVKQAEAQVAQSNSQILQAQAQLAQAQANQIKTQLDVNKYAPLLEQKAVTQQDYDNAAQANAVSRAQVKAAEAGVDTARAQMRAANSQVITSKGHPQFTPPNSRYPPRSTLFPYTTLFRSAQANQIKTQLDVNKYAPLLEQKAVTQQDYDNAAQANAVSRAQVKAAEAGVDTARAQLRAANAQVITAK